MLVKLNITTTYPTDPIMQLLASVNGVSKDRKVVIHSEGIYENPHYCFNPESWLEALGVSIKDHYVDYGVSDNHLQILDKYKNLVNDPDRKYVVMLTKVSKSDQPSQGGWRWHKWGEYIGTHEITTEYLKDEPEVEEVYCYHIYELY